MPEPGLGAACRDRPVQVRESTLVDDATARGDQSQPPLMNVDALDGKQPDPRGRAARRLCERVTSGLVERRSTQLKTKTEERVGRTLRCAEQQRQRDGR